MKNHTNYLVSVNIKDNDVKQDDDDDSHLVELKAKDLHHQTSRCRSCLTVVYQHVLFESAYMYITVEHVNRFHASRNNTDPFRADQPRRAWPDAFRIACI